MSESDHDQEIEEQLDQLQQKAGALIEPCMFASAFRLYGELRRKAKSEQKAIHYIYSVFFQMDQAHSLMDYEIARERSIELISLLQDEEQARKIQPNLPQEHYDYLVYSMSSCAFEKLAEATGQLEGFNSEGMHSCIAEGIQVCRQTGKTACIGCFREYACDVYTSADDAEIAAHQCKQVMDHPGPWSDRGDRRWYATSSAAWIEALNGRLGKAIYLAEKAVKLTEGEGVNVEIEAKIRAYFILDSLLLAAGKERRLPNDPLVQRLPEEGECPVFEFQLALCDALEATQSGDFEKANEILQEWDRKLLQGKSLHNWFETRLRLIANRILAGERDKVEKLCSQLEKKASDASDYLTMRRLTALRDEDTETSPIAIFGKLVLEYDQPVAASESSSESVPEESPAIESFSDVGDAKQEEDEEIPDTPLKDLIATFQDRIQAFSENPNEEEFDSIRGDILGVTPDQTKEHYHDAGMFIHLMCFFLGDAEDGDKVWEWANAHAANHEEEGVVLSVLAGIGDQIRRTSEENAERITAERIEPLHRRALQISDRAKNFWRAGEHFQMEDNIGEAERCYARAFRLDRKFGPIVAALAQLYRDTDRPRDALHVLDLSLREGCEDPRVAWEAALSAFEVERHDTMLTYLDKYEDLLEDTAPWTNYYRGFCNFKLGNYDEAIAAIQKERDLAEADMFHFDVIEGCSVAYQGRANRAEPYIDRAFQTPLREIDFLSPRGIADLYEMMHQTCIEKLNDKELAAKIAERLFLAGYAMDDYFEPDREANEPIEDVQLYRVLVRQPLDENWASFEGCLFGQDDWPAYFAEWGVLAPNEDDARQIAASWQNRCYETGYPEVDDLIPTEQFFNDSPGVVWQGIRFPAFPESDEIPDFGDEE